MEILIRQIGRADLAQLTEISRSTFAETFADSNSQKDMQQYLDASFGEEKLLAELENPESQFFLALSEGEVAGYLKLNCGSAQTEKPEGNTLEIERIYVLSAFQGKKVGQQLFGKALEVARSLNAEAVWLGVWEANTKAIAFYEKNGFAVFGSHEFRLGSDVQTDLLMKRAC